MRFRECLIKIDAKICLRKTTPIKLWNLVLLGLLEFQNIVFIYTFILVGLRKKMWNCSCIDRSYIPDGPITVSIPIPDNSFDVGKDKLRIFPCDTCGKIFSSMHGFKRHRIIHTGEKPYMCGTCGSRFNDKSALRRHVKHFGHISVDDMPSST